MSTGTSKGTMIPDWWAKRFANRPTVFWTLFELSRHKNTKDWAACSADAIGKERGIDGNVVQHHLLEAVKAGAITPIGYFRRARKYRINFEPPVCSTNTSDLCAAQTQVTCVQDATCVHDDFALVCEPSSANGTNSTELNKRTYVAPKKEIRQDGLSQELEAELRSALSPFKSGSALALDLRNLPAQVGIENIPRLIGWLNADLGGARNPVGVAIKNTREGLDAPEHRDPYSRLPVFKSGECVNCGEIRAGSGTEDFFWCNLCRDNASQRFCDDINCRAMHYPWTVCADGVPRRAAPYKLRRMAEPSSMSVNTDENFGECDICGAARPREKSDDGWTCAFCRARRRLSASLRDSRGEKRYAGQVLDCDCELSASECYRLHSILNSSDALPTITELEEQAGWAS